MFASVYNSRYDPTIRLVGALFCIYAAGLVFYFGTPQNKVVAVKGCKYKHSTVENRSMVSFGTGMANMLRPVAKEDAPTPPQTQKEGLLSLVPDDPCDKSAPHVPAAQPDYKPSFKQSSSY